LPGIRSPNKNVDDSQEPRDDCETEFLKHRLDPTGYGLGPLEFNILTTSVRFHKSVFLVDRPAWYTDPDWLDGPWTVMGVEPLTPPARDELI